MLATAEHQQAYVDQLLTELKVVMDLCDNTEAAEVDLMAGIEGRLTLLSQTLAAPVPVAPAPEPAEEPASP